MFIFELDFLVPLKKQQHFLSLIVTDREAKRTRTN